MMLRLILTDLARQPAVKTTIGRVPIRGKRLAYLLRALPPDYSVELSADQTRLLFSWQTPQRRGALSLRAIASPDYGDGMLAALQYVRGVLEAQSLGRRRNWRAKDLRGDLWGPVRGVLGEKRHAKQTAAETADALVAWGWRNY
jgi:hypothetical protein